MAVRQNTPRHNTSFGIRVQTHQGLAYRIYKMESQGAAAFMIRNSTMPQPSFAEKRAYPRFLLSADAEVTLRDGTSLPTQLDEISVRGCYMGALKPIPIGTEFCLRIWEGRRRCELQGKVICMHQGNKLGICGIGVLFGDITADQRSVIDAWLQELASKRATPPC